MRVVIREVAPVDGPTPTQIPDHTYPRDELGGILRYYQTMIDNLDAAVEESLIKFRDGASFVVTGQQVGFMGGPLYTMAKALSAILLAKEKGAVPLFWAATEDHDVQEVASTYILDTSGNLQRFAVTLPEGGAVESIPFEDEHRDAVAAFCQALHFDPKPINEAILAAKRYPEAMIRILALALRGTGILFIEPALLRRLALPYLQRELDDAPHFQHLLSDTLLAFPEGTTGLFRLGNGRRRIGQGQFTRIDEPELISAGAAARCLIQSALIPTLAYVAGPNELAYWAQLGPYFAAHGVPMPEIIRRLSLTLIPPVAGELLTELGLSPWDPLLGKGAQLHYLRNLLHPRNRRQERLLNWWMFQAGAGELLAQLSNSRPEHAFVYLT